MTRVAVVTGAARGIGAATARALSAEGWQLALVDRCEDDPALPYVLASRADLDELVDEIGEAAVGIVADVRSMSQLQAAVDETVDRFGGCDAAVAAAGVVAGGAPVWELPEPAWEVLVETDLGGVWNLARAVIPAMLARPEPRAGRFVAVASAAGLRGMPRLAAYNAVKHGVIGLTRGLAADLGGSGITANAVCPGSTDTEILRASAELYELDSVDEFKVHHLLDRLLHPDEVAAMVAWLCTPASSGVTGAVLPVDAGMTST